MDTRSQRAQIALWMLTKFAMIFFILGLMVVLIGFSTNAKSSLCQGQAQAVTAAIHSSIVNVLSSPVEDERSVIPLERTLSIGGDQFEIYSINLTNHVKTDSSSILIDVVPKNSRNCKASSNVVYSTDTRQVDLTLIGTTEISSEGSVLKLLPSDQSSPSTFLILIKCQEKCWPTSRSLFVIGCTEENPDGCLSFDGSEDIKSACGWKECPAQPVND